MDNSYIESLRKDVKRALKSDKMRFRHTIGVADTSACLASRYGVDMQKALHIRPLFTSLQEKCLQKAAR